MSEDKDMEPDLTAEVEALPKVLELLKPLHPKSRKRVVDWVIDAFDLSLSPSVKANSQSVEEESNNGQVTVLSSSSTDVKYNDSGSLLVASGAAKDVDKVLMMTYWFIQFVGQESVTGKQINDELKQLGHGVGNVTNCFTSLSTKSKGKPNLAYQASKSGKGAQGRKTYKLTSAGITAADKMLNSEG